MIIVHCFAKHAGLLESRALKMTVNELIAIIVAFIATDYTNRVILDNREKAKIIEWVIDKIVFVFVNYPILRCGRFSY